MALSSIPVHDGGPQDLADRDRQVACLSFTFVLDMAAHGVAGLKPLEALLMMAINQANIAPLTRDPAARKRYGLLQSPAPDGERRPVSVRAVAASMRLPYETARRNIRNLEARGVCVSSAEGVLVPAAFMLTPDYLEAARLGHERIHALYRMLAARGLLEPLPAAHYQEDEPPVRGAVRLISDYLLRAAEALVARIGDLPAALIVLALAAAAASGGSGPVLVSVLARRLRLPPETVRRKAAALVEAGHCAAGPRGVSLADPELASPMWRGLLRENAVAVQRLYAGLAERGVVAAWEQMARPAGASSRGLA